ncbi:MAG: SAM-dependent methyltransferase, partial [Xanthomonadales bacterium]|nr:SAM-dependent methyltransferase [Xanthomonadales bacterium]
RPESPQAAQAIVAQYAGDAPDILREDFYNSLLAAYTPEEVKRQLSGAGLDSLGIELSSDRHWMVCGRTQN